MSVLRVPLLLPAHRCASPTRRACAVARLLGFSLEKDAGQVSLGGVRAAVCSVQTGQVVMVTGPSGSGKSTMLRSIVSHARASNWRVVNPANVRLGKKPCVDLHGSLDLDDTLRLLASVGLAEARVLVQRPQALSDGQRDRLRLARALASAGAMRERGPARPTLIVVDECCASLDRLTARCIVGLLARCVRQTPNLSAVLATCHDDLPGFTTPDVHVHCSLYGQPIVARCDVPVDGCVIDVACRVVEDASERKMLLGRFVPMHYRRGMPATVVQMRCAYEKNSEEPLGIVMVSMPTLNSRHRVLAWPGAYDGCSKRAAARKLNDEVRCLSRTIVDPRVRGVGVATTLVREYLKSPLSIRTEAVAAMGRIARFHARAGMDSWSLPPSPPDARLLDALSHAGVESWRVAQPRAVWGRLKRTGRAAFVEHELERWGRGGRGRGWALGDRWPGDAPGRFAAVCARLHEGYTAYTHQSTGEKHVEAKATESAS